jgi:hypothetical protein
VGAVLRYRVVIGKMFSSHVALEPALGAPDAD